MGLKEYAALFLRWFWLIVLVTVLTGATAYIISRRTPPAYRATSMLMVSQSRPANSTDYSSLQANQLLARTYGELLKSPALLKEVASRVGDEIYPETYVNGTVEVQLVRDTQLINLSVTSGDPVEAAEIANMIPVVFSERNEQLQSSRYASSKQSLEKEMAVVQNDINDTQQRLSSLDSDPLSEERARLEANLAQYRTSYADLLKSYEAIRVAEAQESSDLVVINPPEIPGTPVAPNTPTNTALAMVLGLLVAIGVVLAIEYLDDRIKRPQDLEVGKLPVLGSIGVLGGKSLPARLIAARDPRSQISEAYRILRTSLAYTMIGKQNPRCLLVTSPGRAEGKSLTAANLAVSLAQAGNRVIVVDCDLRKPSQHLIFDVDNSEGLTSALLTIRARPVSDFLRTSRVRNVRVLPSGPIPPNPAELLGSQAMQRLLREVGEAADVVLLDSPPALTVADTAILARQADGVVLVLRWGATRREALARAREALAPVGTPVLGVVLNRVSGRSGHCFYPGQYAYNRSPGALPGHADHHRRPAQLGDNSGAGPGPNERLAEGLPPLRG